jgi:transcriptional regulator with XRE-family HTH domain
MTHESLALKLRVLRAERALTIEQAAKQAGVTPETISDAERGRRRPYLPTLRKVAAAYGVPVEELLAEEAEPALASAATGKTKAPDTGPSAPDPGEYDEILIPRSRLTPEVLRGVLEALVEHEHQMEDLSVSMQEGYVEVGLKEPENDAIKGSDPAVWGSEESRPRTPMPGSAGKHIDVEIREDLTSNEPASVTITETSFFELMRDAKANRLTDEDAWQRLLKEARERSAS